MIKVWDKMKSKPNVDFKKAIEQFPIPPSSNAEFYDKFFETFKNGDEILDKTEKFFDDIKIENSSGNNFVKHFSDNPNWFESWDYIQDLKPGSDLRRAIEVLPLIQKQLKDNIFLTNVGGKATYDEIIKKYAGGCSTCDPPKPNSAPVGLRDFDIMLENLDFFSKHFTGIDNAQKVINQLKQTPNFQHHGTFSMDYLKKKGEDFSDEIEIFEIKLEIDGLNYQPDIKLFNSPSNLDFKSWNKTTLDKIPNFTSSVTVPSQFLAYISTLGKPGGGFELLFDFKKIDKDFNSKIDAEKSIKMKYQELFAGGTEPAHHAVNIFESNPAFFGNIQWNGQSILSPTQLRNLAKNDPDFWQSEIFNFVKVE